MKKVVLPLLMLCLTSAGLRAQETETSTTSNDYNKWSIDGAFGVNKAGNPMTQGYHMNVTNLFHADLGFRYMFNTKFGLKLSGGYDVLNDDGNGSLEFKSNVISIGLQGYANLGRIMEFEKFTKRLNLLGHMGVGVSQLSNDEREGGNSFDGEDHLGNFIIGLTGEFRITDRVALTADFTMINNFSQHKTWDGGPYEHTYQGFDSTLYNATIGLTVYLGKHEKHADWFVEDPNTDAIKDMQNRLDELETMMNDSDKDGVPDYLDSEPNTITGVAVDSKGRNIDTNNNGTPDELERYVENNNNTVIDKKIDDKIKNAGGVGLEKLINSGYVNVYFDTNMDKPNTQSTDGINFLITYLKENPSKSADVIGYADEVGSNAYNQDLSKRRAENVKKILVDAGIESSRLNIVANGEQGLGNNSKGVRTVVRRVTFILK